MPGPPGASIAHQDPALDALARPEGLRVRQVSLAVATPDTNQSRNQRIGKSGARREARRRPPFFALDDQMRGKVSCEGAGWKS
jgi:hypothetical protein